MVTALLLGLSSATGCRTILTRLLGPKSPPASQGATSPVVRKPYRESEEELALWHEPQFRTEFTRSYIAVSDLEPRTTEAERKLQQDVFDLMAGQDEAISRQDNAVKKLEEAARRRVAEAEKLTDQAHGGRSGAQSRAEEAQHLASEARAAADAAKKELDKARADDEKSRRVAAAAMLEKTIESDPAASAALYFTLGNIYWQLDRLEDAAAAYQTAVRNDKHPNFRRAWRNLGLVAARLGDYTAALPALTRTVELGGADRLTYGLLGMAYNAVGNSAAAEFAFREAIQLDPKSQHWKMGLAQSLFMQRRFEEAVALCDVLIAETPNNANLWLLQGKAFIGMKQFSDAAQNYEFAIRMGKATAENLNVLADIYMSEEMFDLAIRNYLRALEVDAKAGPDRAMQAARVLIGHGALDEARDVMTGIETLRRDTLADADRLALKKLRARIAVAEGNDAEEAAALEEAVAIDPHDGEALILLGRYYARNNESDKAILRFAWAAKIKEYEPDALVYHAQVLVQQARKYAEAIPLLERAQELRPRENVQDYLDGVKKAAGQNR